MKWISVKDGLPDEYEKILICAKDGDIYVGYVDEEEQPCGNLLIIIPVPGSHGNFIFSSEITHWMPLPEKPE